MTPAERARQIDREEFAAECAAIRQRAYERVGMTEREARIDQWIKRKEPKGSMRPRYVRNAVRNANRAHAANAKPYTAFGHTRTLTEWATETGMSRNTIRNRLTIGWTLEDALTRAVQSHRKPGVVSDFAPSDGTGAGSTAQETPNLTFSGTEA